MSRKQDIDEQGQWIIRLATELVHDVTHRTLQTGRAVRIVCSDLESEVIELLSMCKKEDDDAET